MTPPRTGPDVPYTFGLIGDPGQTHDSNVTLSHYESNPKKGQTVLFWVDTWGSFIERNAAYQPCIWTAGNHELDFSPRLILIRYQLSILSLDLSSMVEPQPSFSAYREASFGHGIFGIKNTAHASSVGTPNQDGYAVEADSFSY
ncbi:hypothetical protein V6N12_071109 [Hibiscus sabdariffa]|uniref:Acid phosphatase n=1 Tax=Hibiscus sabdariffa TaxID=183260 RepID=A0ABR2FIU2_9ROSI